MRVQAAVLDAPSAKFQIRDLELREPDPGEVLVAVHAAGVCHTDRQFPIPPAFPIVLGHEGAGVVEAVGPGVAAVRPGDRVVLTFDSCGHCANCLTGQPAYCAEFIPRNLTGRALDGSTPLHDADGEVSGRWFGQSCFATHALATERNVVRVGDDLPFAELAPLGCGVQTGAGAVVHSLGLRLGESIAVYGAGAVGLSAVMAARAAGAREIIAVDLHAQRRDLALELGATRVFDGADEDLARQVLAATGGTDYALDTTGVPAVMNTALAGLRSRGTLGLVGTNTPKVGLATKLLATKRLVSVFEGDAVPQLFIPQLIALRAQGRMPFDRLVTTFGLDQINDAEAASVDGTVVKPVLLTREYA